MSASIAAPNRAVKRRVRQRFHKKSLGRRDRIAFKAFYTFCKGKGSLGLMDDRAGFCRVRVKFRFGLGRRDAISCKRVPLRKGSARVQLKACLVRRDAISLKAFPSGLCKGTAWAQ